MGLRRAYFCSTFLKRVLASSPSLLRLSTSGRWGSTGPNEIPFATFYSFVSLASKMECPHVISDCHFEAVDKANRLFGVNHFSRNMSPEPSKNGDLEVESLSFSDPLPHLSSSLSSPFFPFYHRYHPI